MPSKEKLNQLLNADMGEFLLSVQKDMSNILSTSDDALREKLAEVYAAARILSNDIDQWQRFCARPEWVGAKGAPTIKAAHRNQALRFAVRMAVGLGKKNANSTVYRYHTTLKQLWLDGTSAEDVPGAIVKGGGIEQMVSGAKTKRLTLDSDAIYIQFEDGKLARRLGAMNEGFTAVMVLEVTAPENGIRKATIQQATADVKKLRRVQAVLKL